MLDLERLSREIVATLRDQTDAPPDIYRELDRCLLEIESDRAKSADQIEEARLCHGSNDIGIPEVPLVSVADDGAVWVQAWVRVAPDTDSE